jgi:hypothetical protein
MNRFAEAVEQARIDVVPKILIGGGQNTGNGAGGGTMGTGNVLEGLLAILLSEKIGIESNTVAAPSSPEAQAMRNEMRARIAPSATPINPAVK